MITDPLKLSQNIQEWIARQPPMVTMPTRADVERHLSQMSEFDMLACLSLMPSRPSSGKTRMSQIIAERLLMERKP